MVDYPHCLGTDAAAGTAAAFSACSALYANRALGGTSSNSTNTTTSPFSAPASLQNSTYATLLLSHAEALHEFAINATAGLQTYQTSVPEAGTAYASSSYGDELAISALMLAWASNSSDRYEEAVGYWQDYGLSGQDQVFNWDSKGPGFAVLATQLSLVEPGLVGNLTGWQSEAENYFDTIVNGTGRSSQTDGKLPSHRITNSRLNTAFSRMILIFRWSAMVSWRFGRGVSEPSVERSHVVGALCTNCINRRQKDIIPGAWLGRTLLHEVYLNDVSRILQINS